MNLSMITSELRLLPDPSLYGGPDLRAEAERMASDRFGRMSLLEMPPVVNLCALRIRMGSDFTSYRIATGVLERVRGLSVCCSPYSCPKMMEGVFIVESDKFREERIRFVERHFVCFYFSSKEVFMKKITGLIMALMLCACLYAQEASGGASVPADGAGAGEPAPSEPEGSGEEESIMNWNYGVKMWTNTGKRINGYGVVIVMTIDRGYMLCTLDDIVDKGGGSYMVTFKLDNANGDTSKTRMMLSNGSPIEIWFGYTVDDPELAYSLFKNPELMAERTVYVKSINELGFVTTNIKPE